VPLTASCAADYGNEAEVGAALAAAIESGKVKREDLFITTKVSPTSQDYCLFSKRAQVKKLKESRSNKLEEHPFQQAERRLALTV
jgi:diketogulonate reductase-like aldo/keto reductase